MIILRWTKAAALLMALGAAGSGAGWVAQGQGVKPGDEPKAVEKAQVAPLADPSVIEVKPAKLKLTWPERGNVEASINRDVICEVEGTTTIISIKPEGWAVKKGEVVAELDSALLRDNLVNQRITTQQAEASYKQAKLVREVTEYAVKEYFEGLYSVERSTLKKKAGLAFESIGMLTQLSLEPAKLARQRLKEAVARRVGPEMPADIVAELTVNDRILDVDLRIRALEIERETTGHQLEVLEKYTFGKRMKELQNDVERAKSDELRRQVGWNLEQTREKKLERQIERCTLKAPGDGPLVYANSPGRVNQPGTRVLIEEGATVRERQKIFSVPDLTRFRINAKVREAIVDQIKVGGPVRIKVDAAANEVLTGTVLSVAPMADPFRQGDPIKVYTTIISIDQDTQKLNLRPGMSASVDIQFDEVDNTIQLPRPCVFISDNDKCFVAVKSNQGLVEWRDVIIGKADARSFEIKSGLKPGELVVRQPTAAMGVNMDGKRRLELDPSVQRSPF